MQENGEFKNDFMFMNKFNFQSDIGRNPICDESGIVWMGPGLYICEQVEQRRFPVR